jgi:hypothetical protein
MPSAADDADFDRVLPRAIGDDGSKTALGKIDAVDAPLRPLRHLADGKINVFKIGLDEPEIAVAETG